VAVLAVFFKSLLKMFNLSLEFFFQSYGFRLGAFQTCCSFHFPQKIAQERIIYWLLGLQQ